MIDIESPANRSVRRGRRAVVVATAAALIAGTVGFLIGRSTDHPGAAVGAVPTTVPSTVGPAPTAAPDVTDTAQNTPSIGTGVAPSGDTKVSAAPSGMYTGGAYEEPRMELLAERTSPGGVAMRAHLSRYQSDVYNVGGPAGWKPAGWCYPQGDLRISIAAPASVNVAHAGWYGELKDGLSVTTFASGYAEGSPIFGAVAQVNPDVTKVTMTTASGLTDSTEPIKGIALLAVDGKIEQDATFTVTKADGTSVKRTTAELTQPASTSEFHGACDPPPPALPSAGEQPADPAAAEAAIRANWTLVRDFAGDPQSRRAYVDDSTGVADAWTALQNGQYADAAKGSTADIKELVFTTPTEAWFRYDVVTPITNFYDRYGVARLGADGGWIFTRQTICQDISLAPGFGCNPPVDTLLPPSAATDPRYNPALAEDTGIVGD